MALFEGAVDVASSWPTIVCYPETDGVCVVSTLKTNSQICISEIAFIKLLLPVIYIYIYIIYICMHVCPAGLPHPSQGWHEIHN